MSNYFSSRQDSVRLRAPELTLQSKLSDAKAEVRRCLCDDFDTPGAVGALQELVKAVNKVSRWLAGVSTRTKE